MVRARMGRRRLMAIEQELDLLPEVEDRGEEYSGTGVGGKAYTLNWICEVIVCLLESTVLLHCDTMDGC